MQDDLTKEKTYVTKRRDAELCQLTEYTSDILDLYLPDALYVTLVCYKDVRLGQYRAWGSCRCSTRPDGKDKFAAQRLLLRITIDNGQPNNTTVDQRVVDGAAEVSANVSSEFQPIAVMSEWTVHFEHPGFAAIDDQFYW
jgi:hypothetical protein